MKVKIIAPNRAKKLPDIIKYSHVHKKRTYSLVFNSQACLKDIINMYAASPVFSLLQNKISASLLSKNSGNETFSGINWMRDFSYSNSRGNDFERYYLTEKSEKCSRYKRE